MTITKTKLIIVLFLNTNLRAVGEKQREDMPRPKYDYNRTGSNNGNNDRWNSNPNNFFTTNENNRKDGNNNGCTVM